MGTARAVTPRKFIRGRTLHRITSSCCLQLSAKHAAHTDVSRSCADKPDPNILDVTSAHLTATAGAVKLVHFYDNEPKSGQQAQAFEVTVEVVRALAADVAGSKLFRVARFDCSQQAHVCKQVNSEEHPLQVRIAS